MVDDATREAMECSTIGGDEDFGGHKTEFYSDYAVAIMLTFFGELLNVEKSVASEPW